MPSTIKENRMIFSEFEVPLDQLTIAEVCKPQQGQSRALWAWPSSALRAWDPSGWSCLASLLRVALASWLPFKVAGVAD